MVLIGAAIKSVLQYFSKTRGECVCISVFCVCVCVCMQSVYIHFFFSHSDIITSSREHKAPSSIPQILIHPNLLLEFCF